MPAELIDRWNFSSTAGPVPHVRTACLQGHVFTVRQESVARVPEPPAATGRRDRVRREPPRPGRARIEGEIGMVVIAAAGVLGVILSGVGTLAYLRDVAHGRTVPHRGSWPWRCAAGSAA